MAFYKLNGKIQAKAWTTLFLVLFGCLTLTLVSSHGSDQMGSSGGRRLMEDERVGSDKINIPKLCVVKSCDSSPNSCTHFCCATMKDEPCWPKRDDCLQYCPSD
uniref:Uncharacterized protein n=1 Tax=Avena sativa TaxID=4498 RepID=A0ACD5Z6D1_AVESA